ncbi:23S rRNA (adenine(2030)-N(6))-methyltransferase RlmJ [Wohlfahrtiimonas chitiniclastica]|uniref:23S rRNA (adenine(2030)-N(6))-methyltransferase RlmJ n=1 Tax=Wohlfahrtiimonas chitiniclastica TaxID=400946 RepID=UPI001BCEEBDC|nr:23S rRNA (adenine(2030)-N(6))-methyltransferase RlmJ [Wohlfahrtiimonas chitiniclastica]MBS7816221.1 23S rRNA (adenine(2030)-N(6))-methyltransferase RlmJ [Wohlfahrtiimonas chitiniclastica]MBS7821784.1 23S rRNA (adenine(2030)-N(6))-methyltransferase RlmJ [Wohlfahrtiimonas chitiniclastica]MBS7829576.1 23S rRNA (adenine(2030)-N(6))-methyltransferase RlmJ [Wohlfahrtiimonas chitiniclastica]MBS7831543.1 23S rRNA (adenine(2030)-N(6))-methyltransferase RlmJ [Wohlfahrtiimonas chitiniclastica]
MLSYRHGFHAGNHADALKHFVLFSVLNYYNQKDKPYWYIDTHSGAGLYDTHHPFAEKTGEYEAGIGTLQQADDLPKALDDFLLFINQFQTGKKRFYPGSPVIAQKLVRSTDRMKLFELHPTDSEILINNMKGQGVKYQVSITDGFKGLIGLLPPSSRRAVVLIDPPYEDKKDYQTVIKTLQEAHERFSTGCYMVWYPLLPRNESLNLPNKLERLFKDNYLNVTLSVTEPEGDQFGMFGSGMFIVNPPYTLKKELESVLPALVKHLGIDRGATSTLDYKIP